jgi:hypothetical protein
MSESKSSSVAVRVLAGVLTAAALWTLSKIPGLLVWFGNIAGLFWSHLKGTSGLPNWGLYVLVFIALHALINFAKRLLRPKGPNVSAYNQDSFMDIVWRWSYIGEQAQNPWAYCPYCDTMLVYSEQRGYPSRRVEQTTLTCERCNRALLHHNGDRDYLVAKILRQIDRNIRTGDWKTIINKNDDNEEGREGR